MQLKIRNEIGLLSQHWYLILSSSFTKAIGKENEIISKTLVKKIQIYFSDDMIKSLKTQEVQSEILQKLLNYVSYFDSR